MTADYILRDQAEALLRELDVVDPDDRRVFMGEPPDYRRAWNQAVELLVAGMRAERAEAT